MTRLEGKSPSNHKYDIAVYSFNGRSGPAITITDNVTEQEINIPAQELERFIAALKVAEGELV
jgi:hypothetical protein